MTFGTYRHSFRQFVDRVSRLAGALQKLGMQPGDRVAIAVAQLRPLPRAVSLPAHIDGPASTGDAAVAGPIMPLIMMLAWISDVRRQILPVTASVVNHAGGVV